MKTRTVSKPDVAAHEWPSEVLPGLWWVARGGWGGLAPLGDPGGCNMWLIRGQEFDVLVDCGLPGPLGKLERNIRRAGGQPSRVREIWLTHSHTDHIGKAADWQAKYPETAVRLSAIGADFILRGDLRLTGAPMHPGQALPLPRRMTGLVPGQTLSCPPYEFRVVALQGHTPDCIAFRGRMAGLDVMFTGDAIIGDQQDVCGGTGWLDGLWLSDVTLYEKTLLAAIADPPQVFLPGHGQPNAGRSVRPALRHCLQRIRRLMAIPGLGYMMPAWAGEKPAYGSARRSNTTKRRVKH